MAVEESLSVIIRAYNPVSDAPLIYSTWRNSIWFDEKRDAKQSDMFFRKLTQKIKNILNNTYCNVRIACLKEDKEIIVGYSVFIDHNLEWIYVKEAFRKKGIGLALTRNLQTISSPQTKIGKAIALKKELKEKNGNTEDRQEIQGIQESKE
jgi:hypothetical protein